MSTDSWSPLLGAEPTWRELSWARIKRAIEGEAERLRLAFLALAVTRLGLPSLLRKFAGEHPSNLAALLLFLHLALEATRVKLPFRLAAISGP